jgi:hypothetical protein
MAVVLNWCAEADTSACVESLLGGGYPGLEVLIVDNSSPDGSGERLRARYPDLHYLQMPENLGYAGGNQRAIEWALDRSADYILICNDDAEVRAGCVAALVSALEGDSQAGAAAPTVLHHEPANIVWWSGGTWVKHKAIGTHVGYGTRYVPSDWTHAVAREVSFFSGCVVMLRARALRACGGFRPEFFAYGEDLELSVRFQRAGWRVLHVPAAVAEHKVRFPAPEASPFAIRLRDRNRRRFVALHYDFVSRLAFALWFYPTRIVHLVRYVVTGDGARAGAIARGMVGK